MEHMDQIAYSYVCALLTMNLLHVIVPMVHVTVNQATLGDSVMSWVSKSNDMAWMDPGNYYGDY